MQCIIQRIQTQKIKEAALSFSNGRKMDIFNEIAIHGKSYFLWIHPDYGYWTKINEIFFSDQFRMNEAERERAGVTAQKYSLTKITPPVLIS